MSTENVSNEEKGNGVLADVSGQLAISALEKITNPIKYLQEEAEKDGAKLNGYMAIEITKDANFYKEIARKALEEIANLHQLPAKR
jgi:uncharacterized protein with ACT and thioredoxin-like domain